MYTLTYACTPSPMHMHPHLLSGEYIKSCHLGDRHTQVAAVNKTYRLCGEDSRARLVPAALLRSD